MLHITTDGHDRLQALGHVRVREINIPGGGGGAGGGEALGSRCNKVASPGTELARSRYVLRDGSGTGGGGGVSRVVLHDDGWGAGAMQRWVGEVRRMEDGWAKFLKYSARKSHV